MEEFGVQLHATSRMIKQNRQTLDWLDWLLAEKGRVCYMFGKKCCTYILENTAVNGTFSEIIKCWKRGASMAKFGSNFEKF